MRQESESCWIMTCSEHLETKGPIIAISIRGITTLEYSACKPTRVHSCGLQILLERVTKLTSYRKLSSPHHGQQARIACITETASPCSVSLLFMSCTRANLQYRAVCYTWDSKRGFVLHACMNLFQIFPQRHSVSLLHHTSHMFFPSARPFIPPSAISFLCST